MASGPRYWTFVSEELPALCQAFFPISSKREETYAAGLSMGGYGAFKLGLACPEKYAAVASLSGALAFGARLAQNEGPERREWESIWGDLTRFVGSPNDLSHLAKELAASNQPRPRLFQWCGTDDFLYQGNLYFRDQLRSLGLEVTYSEGPGGHSWDMWDTQIQNVLTWLDLPAVT
jgi:S-formylglutathione hydrolase FrmB